MPPERTFCEATPGGSTAMVAKIAAAARSAKMRLKGLSLRRVYPHHTFAYVPNLLHKVSRYAAAYSSDDTVNATCREVSTLWSLTIHSAIERRSS